MQGQEGERRQGVLRSADALVSAIGAFAILVTLDQVRLVWFGQDVAGISLLTWIIYALAWLAVLVNANVRRDRFLSIAGFIGVVECALIVVGVLIFS